MITDNPPTGSQPTDLDIRVSIEVLNEVLNASDEAFCAESQACLDS